MKLAALVTGIAAALLVYSQTAAFAWDEGFHLLAAKLILEGRRPYADFLFAQTPLNAVWNAWLIRIFGTTWRAAHAASAVEVAAAVWLTGRFVYLRSPEALRIRLAAAAAIFTGLNVEVFEYGPLAQAYGLCLFLGVVAFRSAAASVERKIYWLAALSGFAAGAAASASLLTFPLTPVLAVWIAVGSKSLKSLAAFLSGALVGLGPILYVLIRWPEEAWFDLVRFHAQFRKVEWENWPSHDFGVLTDWLNSSGAFVLVGLAAVGVLSAPGRGPARRLCGFLLAAMCVFLAAGHPTFPQYFLLVVPFAAILASAGLETIAGLLPAGAARVAIWVAITVPIACLGKALFDERDGATWDDFTEIVETVNSVTPASAALYADEAVYFLSGRMPPEGMEWSSGHKIEMPMSTANLLHVLPQSELDRRVRAGSFITLETCYQSEVDRLGLRGIYSQEKQIGDCFVLWGKK